MKKGFIFSEASKKKMRDSHLGQIAWNKGKKGLQVHSQKTKDKMRDSHKGRPHPWHKGKPLPEETKEKLRKANSGSNRYNWKGGVTSLMRVIRSCYKYRQWRSDIFTRDNYTCQQCGKRGNGTIHADHHPKTFARIFYDNKINSIEQAIICEEFWNINNGRTLCEPCHRKTETYGYCKNR